MPKSRYRQQIMGTGPFVKLSLFLMFFSVTSINFLPAQEQPFRAVLISDTHLGFAKSNKAFNDFLQDVTTLPFHAKVLINNGDVAEVGQSKIFKIYKKGVESIFPQSYCVIGNHDTRWNPDGKQAYQQELFPLYYSKDLAGIHWVFLDSTLEHQTQGHVDFQEMKWIQKDLQGISHDQPILVFSHHPFKWRGVSVDNGLDVINLFRGYNVAAFFNGHGHKLERVSFRQIPFIENDALFHGRYLVMVLSGDAVELFEKKIGEPELKPWFKFPLHPKSSQNEILSPGQGSTVKETFLFKAKIEEANHQPIVQLDRQEPSLLQGSPMIQEPMVLHAKGWHDLRLFLGEDQLPEDQTSFFLPGDILRIHLGEIYGGLATDGKSVFAGTLDGTLFSVSPMGTVLWKKKLDGGILAGPLATDPWLLVGTRAGTFYELSLKTGEVTWIFTVKAPVTTTPAVDGNTVVFGAGDKQLYALDLRSGKELWRASLGAFTEMQPKIAQEKVYVGAWDHTFYAIDAHDGQILWKKNIGKAIYYSPSVASPVVNHGTVLVAAKDHHLYALDAETGEEEWKKDINDGFTSPVLGEHTLYLPEVDGHVKALNLEDGEFLWEKYVPTSFGNASPLLVKNKLLLVGIEGRYFEMDPLTGAAKPPVQISQGFVFSTPVVAEGKIWIGSLDGNLYAIPLR